MAKVWIEVRPGRYRFVDTGATAVGSRVDAPYIPNERLSMKERRSIKLQTGQDFDSRSALNAYMKQNDMRFVDKGDRQDRARTRAKEYLRDTEPGNRPRPSFASADNRRTGNRA